MTTAWILANFVIIASCILISIGLTVVLRTLPLPGSVLVPLVLSSGLFFICASASTGVLILVLGTHQHVADELITPYGLVFDISQAVAAAIAFTMLLIALRHMNVRILANHDFVAAEAESDGK